MLKKNKKTICFLAMISLIFGCATTQNFEMNLKSWLGYPVSNYIAQNNRTPSNIIPTESGGKIYMFEYSQTSYYTTPTRTTASATAYGNTAYGSATTTGGQTIPINRRCNWSFTTDANGIIRNWSYRGNACKSR